MARGGNGSPLAPPQSPARPARLGGEEPAPRGLAPAARALLACLVTVTLALILVIWCEHLAGAELNFPLGYGADADTTYSLAYIQGLLETGSYWHHPRLGMPAPQGISTYQFPQPEALARLMLLALGAFWPSPAVLANLFYLASYPLVAGAALFALRRLGLGWLLAGAFALLYAFLPWHFYREQHHLFYSSYYLVPLMALVALQVAQGRPLVLDQDGRWRPGGRESLEALVLCVLNGLSTVYYAAFAIFFLLVAGLAAWLEERRPAHLARALLLGAVVAAAALAQHAPALAYRASHPGAGPAFSRLPQESEEYGLKIAQLLLPVPGHRLGPWSDLRAYYDRHFPLVNENSSATLGALGSLGFLILLGWLFFRRPRPGDPVLEDLLTRLSILNGAGLLLGTVGGFSSLAGLGFTPLLRSVNRVSIYLAFFSLAALALVLQRLGRRLPGPVFAAGVAGLLVLGLLDQIPGVDPTPPRVDDRPARAAAWAAEAAFFASLEERLPPASMVFQLPALPFPEPGPREAMPEYAHLRGYLFTRTLRWSFGALRDGPEAIWAEAVAQMPPPEMLERLCLAGFAGLYLDRTGYPDGARTLVARLEALLGPPLLTGCDGALLFWDLRSFARALRARLGAAEWGRRQAGVLQVVRLEWRLGWRPAPPEDEVAGRRLRWCPASLEQRWTSTFPQARRVRMQMWLRTAAAQPSTLVLEGPPGRLEVPIGPQARLWSTEFVLPPGFSRVHLDCSAPARRLPGTDTRVAFAIEDFTWTDLGPAR